MSKKRHSIRSRAPRLSPLAPARNLLFEIGTEELPATYIPGLIDQLAREAGQLLHAEHLSYRKIRTFGTPRRLVLLVENLSSVQHKPGEEIRGPSQTVSYDGEGKPTRALLGFIRSQGGALKDTKLVATSKGSYVYLVKAPRALPTHKALPQILPRLAARLHSPKTMRWDASGFCFARPVRWLLSLYGSQTIRCSVGSLSSGNQTWIGAPRNPKPITVASIERYFTAMKKAKVMLDQDARRSWIERTVSRLARQVRGVPCLEMLTHGLLDEVTHLIEEPVTLSGSFDRKYLDLPREVLLASMAKYQRVFAIESKGANRKLLPRFVGILDSRPKRAGAVRGIFEHILNARLADSLLFWKEDHGHLPLEKMASHASEVTFHERLGSMADKTLRLRGLCEVLADGWELSDDERKHLRRACQLAKADLVSLMVKEFPTLQGVVGKYYAKDSGESSVVAEAIEEHYLPLGGRMPKSLIGMALAILDKFDTLSSYFGLGIMPTGNEDPFGLRRAAQGIVEIAWAAHRPLPLDQLLRARSSMHPFRDAKPNAVAETGTRVQRYLFDRLYSFAWPKGAGKRAITPPSDCIDAVLSSSCADLVDIMDRIQSLTGLSNKPGLLRAAKVIERTHNILKGAPLRQVHVDPERLKEPLEQKLWELYGSNESRLIALTKDRSYGEATTFFGDIFFEPLHAFFEEVLVNVPEETLKQNRLALMRAINTLYTDRIADLSKLTILQREE